jgi:protein-disulfide isomerase
MYVCESFDSEVMVPSMPYRRSVIIVGFLLLSLNVSDLAAQTPDAFSLSKRLDALEGAVSGLEREISDLNTMLRALLPPPPIVDIAPVQLNIANAPVKGHASAKIVLVEYSDFECPYCGRHAQSTYQELQRQFVDAGKVKYVFRHLPLEQLHKAAPKAAEAAECAHDQGKFWEFHDRLFANQQALALSDLSAHARAVGLDLPKFQSCLLEGKMAARISSDLAEAARFELTGTPAFLIGELQADGTVRVSRKVSGAQPLSVFQNELDNFLTRTVTKK